MKLNKMFKTFFVTTSLVAASTFGVNSSIAEEIKAGHVVVDSDFEVQLNAYSHFQAGYRTQDHLKEKDNDGKNEKNVSNNRKDFGFYNDTAFTLTAKKSLDEVTYGAKLVLVPTAKRKGSADYNGSHIFVESSFGKVEMGSPINAGSNMFVDAFSITAATGDDWSNYADFSTEHMKQSDKINGKAIKGFDSEGKSVSFDGNKSAPAFVTYAEFFLDSRLVTKRDNNDFSTEPSRAISYYTPKFELGSSTKVQVGVTYIPDSSNTGAGGATDVSSGKNTIDISLDGKEAFEFDSSVKDAFSAGVSLEHNFSDGFDFKLAFTGEQGKSAGFAKRKSASTELNDKKYKLKDLKTYNIGAVLNLGNYSVAGSYGSLGKSLTTPEYHKTGQETKYYTGAVAYTYGPFKSSLSYFKSDQYKNTVDAVALGTDFKLAPGLKPYAEIARFTLKGKPEFFPELKRKKHRGTVALLGLKLSL